MAGEKKASEIPAFAGMTGMDDNDGDMIVPGNNRRMQMRRAARRKLFGARRKEIFLEHLSCTANVAASAAAAAGAGR